MKKKLTPYYGVYRGQTRYVVSIMDLREVYSNEMKKHPALRGTFRVENGKPKSHGVAIGVWFAEIGIVPIKLDTTARRSCFLWDDLAPRLEELKWEPDEINEPIESNSEVAEEEPESTDEPLCTVESVHGVLLQMLNQKMDFIIKSLGGGFELDESILLQLKEVKQN